MQPAIAAQKILKDTSPFSHSVALLIPGDRAPLIHREVGFLRFQGVLSSIRLVFLLLWVFRMAFEVLRVVKVVL